MLKKNENDDSDAFVWMKQLYTSCPFTGKRSWRTINRCLYVALRTAIEIGMKFDADDFQRINRELCFTYWGGKSVGHVLGETFYTYAVKYGNDSAAKAFERYADRAPFFYGQRKRAATDVALWEDGDPSKPVVVTSFSEDGDYINMAHFTGLEKTVTRRLHVSREEFRKRQWTVRPRYG